MVASASRTAAAEAIKQYIDSVKSPQVVHPPSPFQYQPPLYAPYPPSQGFAYGPGQRQHSAPMGYPQHPYSFTSPSFDEGSLSSVDPLVRVLPQAEIQNERPPKRVRPEIQTQPPTPLKQAQKEVPDDRAKPSRASRRQQPAEISSQELPAPKLKPKSKEAKKPKEAASAAKMANMFAKFLASNHASSSEGESSD